MWLMHSLVCMMTLVLSVPSLLGQGSIEVDGTVRDKDTNQKLSGVEVTVLQDGQPYDVVRTLGNGKYTLSLDHGADYQLVFTYEDLSVRSVEVNTSTIPDAFRERPFFLNVEMSLFEVPPGFDQSLLDEPIGKVSFDEAKEKLDWDLRYTRNMQNRIESALESAAESGGAEADEGGNAPATNRAYEEHMRKAEVEFGRGRYEQSINWLERALNEVPGDARAEAMMEEAVELQAEAEEAAAIDADYERLMREGKIQLKRKEWDAARTALESALELKPDEAEPRELLAEIPSGNTEEEVVSEPVQEEEDGDDDAASARADRAAQAAADAAAKEFTARFRGGAMPSEMPEIALAESSWPLPKLMVEAGLAKSTSEARRLIQGGGVKQDGEPLKDVNAVIELPVEGSLVLQAGKRRFARLSRA